MEDKFEKAVKWYESNWEQDGKCAAANAAANIYADNYDEYMEIWLYLKRRYDVIC